MEVDLRIKPDGISITLVQRDNGNYKLNQYTIGQRRSLTQITNCDYSFSIFKLF